MSKPQGHNPQRARVTLALLPNRSKIEHTFDRLEGPALRTDSNRFTAVEICAGAGGQALGLTEAGFHHLFAVELDPTAADTLRSNLRIEVAVGDVADPEVWSPADFQGVDLFAGGVPCPPFSIAGKQLGSNDERDLFAWAVEQVAVMKPRAVLLENVRGLAASRFSGYRQRVIDRLSALGYIADWRLLHSADFGVAQLRPRFILVALRPEDAPYFHWPTPQPRDRNVGPLLRDLMAANGWPYADEWAQLANGIAPTLVGGSKKHGGADLGPTRAKQAWRELFVDGKGVADSAPGPDAPGPREVMPRLTIEMVARLQGWSESDNWAFAGRKTSQYRQIGNAFPPPVARAVGGAIADALMRVGEPSSELSSGQRNVHDPVYTALANARDFVSIESLVKAESLGNVAAVERRLASLSNDFELLVEDGPGGTRYRLGDFKGFVGQGEHARRQYFEKHRNRVS
ncbi:DNA (cytosine-5-)-methyltransferase [Agrococcus sp. Marseille-Q4369]|uniref:DNA cytosine methyltransferase n=1 Tax=Agrococcus sp. Marseille-Q4369 TaxID=2810513 RepID=UPI001B8DA074|nr:DNA (cytosine-5-)-methyltransferase [Agrococcus sp. Marseille-Q4369]QUW18226.1 DNA (cytosine-5-)-methyltransferase [Agrococcus sp. Marseille-Q4369]